jgi:protein-S-isoprenylcysteine O-methyltransferase Ste14
VRWRSALQAIAFSALAVGVMPASILHLTGADARPVLLYPFWLNSLYAQLLAIPAVAGLSAVQEFAARGHGTPIPYDPPVRLVRTGLYRYVANPMQLAMCLYLLCCGLMVGSWWVAAAGLISFAYSSGIAWWDEGRDMASRFPDAWTAYRSNVRAWIPRWRPPQSPEATIYVALTCEMCRGLGGWLARRNPRALVIAPAELHPGRRLTRITYECEGYIDDGVCAFARALEHINLPWTLAGCAIRLPIIREFLQLVVDVSGGGPLRIDWDTTKG